MKCSTEKSLFVNYPDLNEAIISLNIKYVKLLRIWYIFRFLDKRFNNARGCFPQKVALKILSYYLKISKSYSYEILKDGKGFFWFFAKHKDGKQYLHYYGSYKLAKIYDIKRYSEENYLPFDMLLSNIYQVRADLYSTAIGRKTSITPIARETIEKYYNIGRNTQRKYEKTTELHLGKISSFIELFNTDDYDKALEMVKRVKQSNSINPEAVKIKRSGNNFLILYQRGNVYSSLSCEPEYSSSLKKCNRRIKKHRREEFLHNNSLVTASGNNEQNVGAPVQRKLVRDLKIYYSHMNRKKKFGGFIFRELQNKDRYVFKEAVTASSKDEYYAGNIETDDIYIYEIDYCNPNSSLRF